MLYVSVHLWGNANRRYVSDKRDPFFSSHITSIVILKFLFMKYISYPAIYYFYVQQVTLYYKSSGITFTVAYSYNTPHFWNNAEHIIHRKNAIIFEASTYLFCMKMCYELKSAFCKHTEWGVLQVQWR